MRIIHGHDYYDSALAYGQDDTVVLVRQKSNVLTRDQAQKIPRLYAKHGVSLLATHPSWRDPSKGGLEIMNSTGSRTIGGSTIIARPCGVWVAGGEWNGVCLDVSTAASTKRIYAWSWQSLVSWGHAHGVEFPVRSKKDTWRGMEYVDPEWFGERPSHGDLISWMVTNRATIITLDPEISHKWYAEPTWRVNGDNLRTMEFYKAVDAFSIFQKISQWVGGVLSGTANPMVEIKDDVVKAHKHGFDRWSFRKPPQEKNR